MHQVFIFLLNHLHFFVHFSFTFMENLFMDHPISTHSAPRRLTVLCHLLETFSIAVKRRFFSKQAEKFHDNTPNHVNPRSAVTFLDAFSHLYKRVRPSVRPSVRHTRVEIANLAYYKQSNGTRRYVT